jgi:hypothetical protein
MRFDPATLRLVNAAEKAAPIIDDPNATEEDRHVAGQVLRRALANWHECARRPLDLTPADVDDFGEPSRPS